MLSPLIFKLDGRALRVEKKKFYQHKFDDDIAYIFGKYNPYVYPYNGTVDNKSMAVEPGIYNIKEDNSVFVKRPYTDEEKVIYSVNNIITLTPESIFKDLNKTEYVDIDTSPVFGEDDIFKPMIKSTDDLALAGLKFAIGEKNINFNSYANKFSDSATKNNGRRALTHGNTLKMDMLSRFAEVFDIGVGLVFFDKEGCPNPMDKKYKNAYIIFDSESTDLTDKNIIEISTDQINRNDEDDES